MNKFAEETKTIRADGWDDDEEVVIKMFTYHDRQQLMSRFINVHPQMEIGESASYKIDLGAMNLAILELGIVSWTFKGEDGKVVPCTKKWIHKLRPDTGDFILAEINAFNRRRSAAEQESFRGDGGDGSAEQ